MSTAIAGRGGIAFFAFQPVPMQKMGFTGFELPAPIWAVDRV
jgi:hypothetical protein